MTDQTKTEQQIERDKEAVQRMIGAKGAMEAAIRRIACLESTLRVVDRALHQHSDNFGPTSFTKTHNHGVRGAYCQEARVISMKEFIQNLRDQIGGSL